MNKCECLLYCGCWVRVPIQYAKVNAGEICKYHGETGIKKVLSHEWHVRCLFPECRFSRWFGQSETLARQSRDRHKAKPENMAHATSVAYDRVTYDGKGSVFREARDKPKPPPVPEDLKLWDDGAVPF